MESLLQNHEWTLEDLKDNLAMGHNRMKQQADQHRSEHSFEVADLVFLHLQPYN